MQMYEDKKKNKRRNSCGYCRKEGHNKLQCPEVAKDWAWWKDFQVPPYSPTWWKSRQSPKSWGEWYIDCRDTYEKQVSKSAESNSGKKRKRSPSSCGYCGETDHNRRNCTEMQDFLKKCYKANENWRREAYKEIVEKHGICVGACIQVRQQLGWSDDYTEHVAIITSVNFDKLNVMAAHDGTYSGHTNPYECILEVKAMINQKEFNIAILTGKDYRRDWAKTVKTNLNHKIVRRAFRGWSADYIMDKLLSPSEHPLDEKWITDYRDAFDYLTKKRKKIQLENDQVNCLINKWAEHL